MMPKIAIANNIYIVINAPPIILEVPSETPNWAYTSGVDIDHPIRKITAKTAMPMADFNNALGLLKELIRGKIIAAKEAITNKINAAGIP